jgi:hypothetical protein
VRGQLARTTEANAAGLGALAAVLGTSGNQRAFELGKAAKAPAERIERAATTRLRRADG